MTSQRLRRDKKAKIMQSVEVIEKMILTNSSFVYFSIYKLFLYYSIIHFFNKLYIVGSLVLNPWSNFVIRSWVVLWSLVPVTKMDMNESKRHDPEKNFQFDARYDPSPKNWKLAFGFFVRSCRIPLNILTATKKSIKPYWQNLENSSSRNLSTISIFNFRGLSKTNFWKINSYLDELSRNRSV